MIEFPPPEDTGFEFRVFGSEGLPEGHEAWDRYRLLERLGSGGMGQVYRAMDLRLNRQVAIKFIRREDPVLARRLTLEAQLQAGLGHENIVQVFEVGAFRGWPYISMQLVEGCSLGQAAGRLALREEARLLMQVARALHAAHLQGIVHRDLKPSNILLEEREGALKPYLADFGLARLQGAQETSELRGAGTLAYMSPEHVEGIVAPTPLSDVYSLGAILYELLDGDPPHHAEGSSDWAWRQRILQEEPVPPSHRGRKVPLDLETIALKALEREPFRRYASALALAEDLERWLEGLPVRARRAGWMERGAKLILRLRRNRLAYRIVKASLALVAGVAFLGGWGLWRARRRAEFMTLLAVESHRMALIGMTAMMRPPHDTRPEMAQIDQILARLQEQSRGLGGVEGALNYALGWGHSLRGDRKRSKEEFERAWAAGFRTSEVADGLGAILFEESVGLAMDLDFESDPQRARELKGDIEALRRRAAFFLDQDGEGGARRASLRKGLKAFCLRPDEGALDLLEEGLRQDPQNLHLHVHKSMIQICLALQATEDFGPRSKAFYLRAATASLRRASNIARSDSGIYIDLAWSLGRLALLNPKDPGAPRAFAESLEACALAATLDPDDPTPSTMRANLMRRWPGPLVQAASEK